MAPSGGTPDWLKARREDVDATSEPFDDEDTPPLMILRLIVVGLVLIISAATIYIFLDTPERLVIGIVPTGAAITILVVITERVYTLTDKAAYLAVAVAVNVYYTITVNELDPWSYYSLASMVLFSGVIGLAILDSDVREMPKTRRIVVFAFVLVFFLASNLHVALSPDGDLRYLRIWLSAAYVPLAALVVFATVFVAVYPRGAHTMPADKWV